MEGGSIVGGSCGDNKERRREDVGGAAGWKGDWRWESKEEMKKVVVVEL